MKKYSCSTVLQKEAATSPDPARKPPMMMIGRLPYLFTRILLTGPKDREKCEKVFIRECVLISSRFYVDKP